MTLVIVIVLCSIALIGFGLISYLILHHRNRFQLLRFRPGSSVLLVTAHPDDEVMFFAPTVHHLVDRGFDVVLLCLSDGNYEGLGVTRRKELELAATNLGIRKDNIFVDDFADDPALIWDATVVASAINKIHAAHKFSAIFTFDKWGISQHKNHIACFHGASLFARSHQDVSVYFLKTVNLLRKYCSFLDALFEIESSQEIRFVSSVPRVVQTIAAMQSHQSQLVWFRWLYILFSRYLYYNSYQQAPGPKRHLSLFRNEL